MFYIAVANPDFPSPSLITPANFGLKTGVLIWTKTPATTRHAHPHHLFGYNMHMIDLLHTLTLAPRELLRKLFWLRWYGLAAQTAVILASRLTLHIALPLHDLWPVLSFSLGINLFTGYRLRRNWPVTAFECWLQLTIDTLTLTLLLYFCGGASNPFVSLLLLPVIIAATSLPIHFAWILTFFGIVAYSWLLHTYIPLSLPAGSHLFNLHLVGMWMNFMASALLITFFIGDLTRLLRQRDHDIARLREQNLRHEQIIAIASLAAGAAHELSTPLATMSLLTETLQEDCLAHAADNPDIAQSLLVLRQQIQISKQILTRLTQQGAARAETIQHSMLTTFLPSAMENWQLMRPQAKYQICWLSEPPDPVILSSETLAQALINFCNNAADASKQPIEIAAEWDATAVDIHICDRGNGFPPHAPIGQAFFTTKQGQGGTGIGIMLANASIEQLGGSVRVKPRQGGGTCVSVRLPRIPTTSSDTAL